MSARTWALTGSMRTIDSDSDTVAAELVWRPEAGGGVDHVSASLTVELPIDLGAMGATTVFVPVPRGHSAAGTERDTEGVVTGSRAEYHPCSSWPPKIGSHVVLHARIHV